ncbi:Sphingomyelin phosphodiesterase 4 [Larimichthys crocea]|uniref:Sphingomyelin phosphodiesterase 4 n=1 Tax=Larimichthys crocea TaxID=215358 RepID=A0A6G0J5C5_LARCR|nr:Sphingomyelin phosphodiesterase 4 [Larimichthys crocea]
MSSMPCQPYAPPGSGTLHTYQVLLPFHSPPPLWGLLEEPFSPTEEHVLVRLLVKHLHAFSNSLKPEQLSSPPPHLLAIGPLARTTSPLEEFKRVVVQRFVQQKLYLFLQHCFGVGDVAELHPTVEIHRREDQSTARPEQNSPGQMGVVCPGEPAHVHEALPGFPERTVRTDLVNAKNALMVFRVAKVFAQPNLAEMIQKGEQFLLEPEHVLHHRQPRGYLTPGQGGSFLSSRQRVVTDMVFRVKSHVYALEGQDCQYKQMFGTELRGAVMKLIQIIAQARQTAKRISDHSNEVAANNSFLSWFGRSPPTRTNLQRRRARGERRVFEEDPRIPGQSSGEPVSDLQAESGSADSAHIQPGFLSGRWELQAAARLHPGRERTHSDGPGPEAGQYQRKIISGLRRFDIHYQGDPELQPIRSYENALLVRLFYRISSLINDRVSAATT